MMCEACDVDEAARDGRWPEVIEVALGMFTGAPAELMQPVWDALAPLVAWYRAEEDFWEQDDHEPVTEEEQRLYRERLEKHLAPVRASEAAWAEHLRELAATEGRTDDRS